MGIPSPIASPLLKLKQLSPELPLLEAVEELSNGSQACELLPPAVMDLKASYGGGRSPVIDSMMAPVDAKDSEASGTPRSKDSTEPPRDNESLETGSASSVSKTTTEAGFDSRTMSPSSPFGQQREVLQAKGVIKVDVSALVPISTYADPATSGSLMQLLCQIWRDGIAGMSITPCMGDDVGLDLLDCEYDVFWCFVKPQEDGTVLITPCTDAAACGVLVDTSGASLESTSETVGAPQRPSAGSYAPAWVYGTQWPYCVAPTTLVLGNLPEDLLQEDLIEVLDKEGFSGFYNFLYLPSEADTGRNAGYAIVNLLRHDCGLALAALMHGRSSWCGSRTSECQVTWSVPLQGLPQLIEHYRYHPACEDSVPEDMRPTFFSGGWPRPFPAEEMMPRY